MAIRWGILSTANIARSSFLPGLRATRDGVAYAVAGRDRGRTEAFAQANGVEHVFEGYSHLLEDENVDAVYIPLPNSLHAQWTIAALQAGKAVLCEKPLCTTADETMQVLAVARETQNLLCEAFVFPWRKQTERIRSLIDHGVIGSPREIQGSFYFQLRNRDNIRLDPKLGGGALYDVGCYPIRLAGLLFGGEAETGVALPGWSPEGVDEEMRGVLAFPDDRHLTFSCGMALPPDTFTRILGTEGEIRLTNPYHPNAHDTLELRCGDDVTVEYPSDDVPSFTPALEHIHTVLRDEAAPQHLAIEDALSNARAIDLLYRSARTGKQESS